MTYNHAGYIAQCLDSILEQQTEFMFEICLGEDASSDGTREICKEYAENHPDIIRLFLHKREDVVYVKGRPTAQGNFSSTMKQARGKYMILCDGDDYWCDPMKLQKQVDYLQSHEGMVGCFHRIARVDQDGKMVCADCGPPPGYKQRYTQADFLQHGGFSPLFSVLFENHYADGLPSWFMQIEYVDLPLHIHNTSYGDYGFFEDVMGCYRVHQGGMSSGVKRSRVVSMTLDSYMVMADNMSFDQPESYQKGLRALRISLFVEKLMEAVLPARIKVLFDQYAGRWVRRLMRKCIGG